MAELLGEDRFEALYEEILPELQTQEPFVGPGTCPDADFTTIFLHFLPYTGLDAATAQEAFGHWVFPRLAAVFPMYVENHNDARSFLKTVDSVIHVEVRKLYADARLPGSACEDSGPDTMIMTYTSARGMNSFLEGLYRACGGALRAAFPPYPAGSIGDGRYAFVSLRAGLFGMIERLHFLH